MLGVSWGVGRRPASWLAGTSLVVVLGLGSGAQANEFYLEDVTGRLPADPGANGKDTLDVDLADIDGDGDLDLFVADGSASAAPFPNKVFLNDGAGHFTDATRHRLAAGAPGQQHRGGLRGHRRRRRPSTRWWPTWGRTSSW